MVHLNRPTCLLLALSSLGLGSALSAADPQKPDALLKLAGSISLEKVSDRIDHFALDSGRQRLYLAALGDNAVEIIDLAGRMPLRQLTGFGEPQGIAIGAEPARVVIANGSDGVCRIYDAGTLQPTGSVNLKDDADNVRCDAATGLFWVGHAGGALAAIDVTKNQVVADIPLAAHPESFQLERHGPRIFVNVPRAHEVTVIDRGQKAVTDHWQLEEAASNFPMALDEANHRLFVGCRSPAKLLVLDTDSGATIATVAIVGDADDVWYDRVLRRIYVTGGEGFVSVISQVDADHYALAGKVTTGGGARTSYLDEANRTLYVAIPHRYYQPAEIRIYQTVAP